MAWAYWAYNNRGVGGAPAAGTSAGLSVTDSWVPAFGVKQVTVMLWGATGGGAGGSAGLAATGYNDLNWSLADMAVATLANVSQCGSNLAGFVAATYTSGVDSAGYQTWPNQLYLAVGTNGQHGQSVVGVPAGTVAKGGKGGWPGGGNGGNGIAADSALYYVGGGGGGGATVLSLASTLDTMSNFVMVAGGAGGAGGGAYAGGTGGVPHGWQQNTTVAASSLGSTQPTLNATDTLNPPHSTDVDQTGTAVIANTPFLADEQAYFTAVADSNGQNVVALGGPAGGQGGSAISYNTFAHTASMISGSAGQGASTTAGGTAGSQPAGTAPTAGAALNLAYYDNGSSTPNTHGVGGTDPSAWETSPNLVHGGGGGGGGYYTGGGGSAGWPAAGGGGGSSFIQVAAQSSGTDLAGNAATLPAPTVIANTLAAPPFSRTSAPGANGTGGFALFVGKAYPLTPVVTTHPDGWGITTAGTYTIPIKFRAGTVGGTNPSSPVPTFQAYRIGISTDGGATIQWGGARPADTPSTANWVINPGDFAAGTYKAYIDTQDSGGDWGSDAGLAECAPYTFTLNVITPPPAPTLAVSYPGTTTPDANGVTGTAIEVTLSGVTGSPVATTMQLFDASGSLVNAHTWETLENPAVLNWPDDEGAVINGTVQVAYAITYQEFSDWGTAHFTVNVDPPAPANVTMTMSNSGGNFTLEMEDGGGTYPADHFEVWRIELDPATHLATGPIRIGANIYAPTAPDTAIFIDNQVGTDATYTYFVRAVSAAGGIADQYQGTVTRVP